MGLFQHEIDTKGASLTRNVDTLCLTGISYQSLFKSLQNKSVGIRTLGIFGYMDCVMVLESSFVIHTFQMANMAHEWMNLCQVITHIIMVNEDHFTSTTFVNLTAVNCTIIVFAVLARTSPVCFRNRRHSKGS